jgi:hypothetical protein
MISPSKHPPTKVATVANHADEKAIGTAHGLPALLAVCHAIPSSDVLRYSR